MSAEKKHPNHKLKNHIKHDEVEEADLESFPASDPPAWTSGKTKAHQHRPSANEETPIQKNSHSAVHHFYLVIRRFFGK